jgi:hypothetical protein
MYLKFYLVSLILAFFRNLIISKEKDFSHVDVHTVITLHFKHYYYIGNILFALCLLGNHIQLLEKYAFNCFLCLLTLIIYCKAYYTHLKRSANIKLGNFFNLVSFSVNISFLLAWNVCYITISASSFMSIMHFQTYTINIILQITLSLFVILALTFFNDFYFSFIVLVFEIGSTLNKNMFKLVHDSGWNFSLIITVFTVICFLSSLIHKLTTRKKEGLLEDLESINYNNEKDRL